MSEAAVALELRALRAELRDLRRLVEQMQPASHLPPPERELIDALAAVIGEHPFTSGEALELARLHLGDRPRLSRALDALGIASAKKLGERLRPIVDQSAADRVRVVRCGKEHGVALWRVEALGDRSPSAPGGRP